VNATIKTVVFWLVIVLSAFLLWQVVKSDHNAQRTPEISYSEFLSQVDGGNVAKVTISKTQVYGKYRDGSSFRVTAPTSQEGMLQALHQKNVEIWFRDDAMSGGWPAWLLNLAPLILLAALWFFMIRQLNARQARTRKDQGMRGADSRWPSG
jgi:cell division protease FtsH